MNEVSPKYNVLLIEDDDRLAQLVAEYLDSYEFAVTIVRRGDIAVAAVREHKPALVILDLMLPNMDGMEVCRRIRGFSSVPVLILTARVDVFDQVAGLETGADDYVVKPIEPRVLVARARALLRRSQPAEEVIMPAVDAGTLTFGELVISPPNRTVTWRGQDIDLKTAEFNLLVILARAAGTVLSRDDILSNCAASNSTGWTAPSTPVSRGCGAASKTHHRSRTRSRRSGAAVIYSARLRGRIECCVP